MWRFCAVAQRVFPLGASVWDLPAETRIISLLEAKRVTEVCQLREDICLALRVSCRGTAAGCAVCQGEVKGVRRLRCWRK